MTGILLGAAFVVLLSVLAGLWRVLRGPHRADRLMAAQLLCTGGIAALLLVAGAYGLDAILDVALLLALLGAFTSVAFVMAARLVGPR
jgi:multicomponent Na+:H+ antiporter subunit F